MSFHQSGAMPRPIDPAEQGDENCRIARLAAAWNDLEQQFVARRAAGAEQAPELSFLCRSEIDIIIGMAAQQALDHMLDRPFLQPHGHVVAAFELERGLLRHLDRSRDQMPKSAGAIKGFLAVAIIEDDAETRGIAGRRPRRPIDQRLEARDLLARLPALSASRSSWRR